tara:strand:+ start:145 stop:267 length:123 start_codon:yes stop_codon:yes gene_type:complete
MHSIEKININISIFILSIKKLKEGDINKKVTRKKFLEFWE